MKTTVNLYEFRRAFHDMNRGNNFSEAGLTALFDYLEEYEQSTGDEIELDVIALCCEYTEYENLEEYNNDYEPVKSVEDIEKQTTVIRMPDSDGFIIQAY